MQQYYNILIYVHNIAIFTTSIQYNMPISIYCTLQYIVIYVLQDATIQVNAILRIAFVCIAIHCCITM